MNLMIIHLQITVGHNMEQTHAVWDTFFLSL